MTRAFQFITHLLFGVSAAFLFSRCSDNTGVDEPPPPDKPYLTITQALPTAPFGAQGGSASLVFSTNESWRITSEAVSETEADAWYDITPLSGDGGKDLKVTVSIQPNEAYTGRGFTLVLHSKTHEKRIEVSQLKKNAIIADENRLEISSAEQPLTIRVQANVSYKVNIKEGEAWIREAPQSRAGGLTEEEHRFTIEANPLAEERTGVIVFQDTNSELFDEVTIIQAAWEDPDPQRAALRAIYDAAGGGAWTHSENWCSDKPLGEWYGVETDGEGNVTALRLADNNLAGTVSWDIAKLTKLRHLDLSRNALSGDITEQNAQFKVVSYLDELTEAETIDLSRNRLTGQFMPIDGNKLLRLKTLNLSHNQLQGFAFPLKWEPMFQNGRMVDLILNGNTLHDDVPDVIQNHPQWSRLALQFIRQYYGSSGGIRYTKDIRLPDFTFTDLRDGSQSSIRTIYSSNTRTMILNWNPLQEDSKTFMETTVRRVHTLFGGQGLAVVAITPEGEEYRRAAEQYLLTHDVPYPVATDYTDAQGQRPILPADPYPSYFFVDQYGIFSNDMFTGQYCSGNIYPAEPSLIDFMARPFQHTDNINTTLKKLFGNSKYQSTDFSRDKTFETLQRATKGKGIDIVLLGEAFTDVDIETGYYKQVMEMAMEAFFVIEPTKSYREYFNIHMVYAVSRDSYIAKSGTNTALGVLVATNQWFDINTAAYRLPDYYHVVAETGIPTIGVVVNNTGGGVTRMQSPVFGPVYAFTGFYSGARREFNYIFTHETVGHGYGLFGDEYTKQEPSFQGEIPESEKRKLRNEQSSGLFLNLSLTDDPKSVYWSHLIGNSRYPYVGIYQGGYYYAKGIWRSEAQSSMFNQNYLYFNTICRELIVRRIMKLAGEEYTFEKFLEKDSDEGRSTLLTPRRVKEERRHQPPIIVE